MRTTTFRTNSWRPSRLPEPLAPSRLLGIDPTATPTPRLPGVDRRAPAGLRVLGVDPGLVATGFAVLVSTPDGFAVLASGVIATRADQPLEARLGEIHEGLVKVMEAQAPALLVVEDLYAEYRFPRTALQMAHARGVIYLAARQCGLPVLALAPAEVKRVVTGNGAAGKEQMQHATQRLLGLSALPAPSHIADALALAFTGLSRSARGRPLRPVAAARPGAPPARP
jgi:crossover junction endodeoxyribonuclease RuvC